MYIKVSIKRKLILVLAFISFIHESFLPVIGITVYPNSLEDLTKQILRKEFELERLNLVFRKNTTLTSTWRQRRMFLYGEGNASITEAGLLLSLAPYYQISDQKTYPHKKLHGASPSQLQDLKAATRLYLIANAYGAGADLFELGVNFENYLSLRKKGFTPATYRERVHNLRIEIDNLIKERRAILLDNINLSREDKVRAEAEGKLLDDLRDLYLLEYRDYHDSCKKFWLVQNAAFVTDFLKNTTGGAGNIVSLEGYHIHDPYLFGTAGLLNLISAVIILGVPVVGRVTGNVSGLTARRIVSQEIADVRTSTMETYCSDLQNFLALNKTSSINAGYAGEISKRSMLYEDQEKIMSMRNEFVKKEKKDAHNSFIENIVFAGIVGSTKTASGICTMIGGWKYPRSIPTNVRLYAAGNTTYTVGAGFSMFETARLATQFEWSNWKLRNSDLLPSNQFNRRLRMLDNMDSFINK